MKIGDRVGAFASITPDGVAHFFGYGTYQGDEIPSPDVVFAGMKMSEILEEIPDFKNPQILLDNGDIVWGCECWWEPEEKTKQRLNACKEVIHISVDKYRRGGK